MTDREFVIHVCKTCETGFLDLDKRNAQQPVMSKNCPACRSKTPKAKRQISEAQREARRQSMLALNEKRRRDAPSI